MAKNQAIDELYQKYNSKATGEKKTGHGKQKNQKMKPYLVFQYLMRYSANVAFFRFGFFTG